MTTKELLKLLKRNLELLDSELSERLDRLSKEADLPKKSLDKCDNRYCVQRIELNHDKEYLFVSSLLSCADVIGDDFMNLCKSLNIDYDNL